MLIPRHNKQTDVLQRRRLIMNAILPSTELFYIGLWQYAGSSNNAWNYQASN